MAVGARSLPLKVGCDTKQRPRRPRHALCHIVCTAWQSWRGVVDNKFVKHVKAENMVILHQHETKSKLGQQVRCAAGLLYCTLSHPNTHAEHLKAFRNRCVKQLTLHAK